MRPPLGDINLEQDRETGWMGGAFDAPRSEKGSGLSAKRGLREQGATCDRLRTRSTRKLVGSFPLRWSVFQVPEAEAEQTTRNHVSSDFFYWIANCE